MRWSLRAPKPQQGGAKWSHAEFESARQRLASELKLSAVVAGLLVRRGFCEPEEARVFLNPKFEDLHSPYLMRGMKEAVERLQRAIANKEQVLIYGDYDVLCGYFFCLLSAKPAQRGRYTSRLQGIMRANSK